MGSGAHRCSPCGVDWPAKDLSRRQVGWAAPAKLLCPLCGEGVDWIANASPISDSESKHRRFEKFADEWDAARMAEQELELARLGEA